MKYLLILTMLLVSFSVPVWAEGVVGISFVDQDGDIYQAPKVNGMPMLIAKPYGLEVSEGNVPDTEYFRIHGHNSNVGSVREDIWEAGTTKSYLSLATLLEIESDNVNDTGTGVGARSVYIEGIDASYNFQAETVTLNGTSTVNSLLEFLDVYKTKVLYAGNGEYNYGTITVKDITGTYLIDQIAVRENVSHSGTRIVPAGYTAYIDCCLTTEVGVKAVEVGLWRKRFGGYAWEYVCPLTLNDFGLPFYPPCPYVIPEKSIIKFMGECAGNDGHVTVILEGRFIKN